MKKGELYGVKRVIRVMRKEDVQSAEIEYWSAQTPEQRLSALQILREQQKLYMNKLNAKSASRKRFRRIHKTAQQV